MARTPLQVRMTLGKIHCHREADWGSAEPYLWTIFFKVDGDTVWIGDGNHLHGVCTLMGTPGSHGNLGDDDVDAGDDVLIPSAIGDFQTILRPIPFPFPDADAGGVVGVVVVLMEEDWVTNAGAEAGHAALNITVKQGIDAIIPKLNFAQPSPTPDDIDELTREAKTAVRAAIKDAQTDWDNFTSWLHRDDMLGFEVFTFSHDELLKAPRQKPLRKRWQTIREWNNVPVVVDDWELFGRVDAVAACPITAVTSTLNDLGVLDDAEVRAVTEAGHEFRRTTFATRSGLGAWWTLAERNSAAIAGVLHDHPDLARHSAAGVLRELVAMIRDQRPVSDDFVTHTTNLLNVFVSDGPRRLRIDAKAALAILTTLRGKRIGDVAEILDTHKPTRKQGTPMQRASEAAAGQSE